MIIKSEFYANRAENKGGSIYYYLSLSNQEKMINYTLSSINSRYLENEAKYGGAMYIYGNSLSDSN